MAVRVGVIGAGAYAQRAHLPPLQEHPDAEIAALCRRNPSRLAEAADAFNVPGRFTDYAALLADDSLDAVTVSLPHNLHYDAVRAALMRDRHVLVDKPLTLRLDHARELLALAERRGLTLMVAFNRHYEPPFTKAHELLRDGAIGELRLIQAYMAYDWDLWLRPPDRRFTGSGAAMLDGVSNTQATLLHETSFRGDAAANGGGFFADGGAHLLEACLWLAESPAATVFAQMDSPAADLYTALNLRLESGALCSLACVGDTPTPRDFGFRLYGTTGALHMRWGHLTLERELRDTVTFDNTSMPFMGSAPANFIDVILGPDEPRATAQHGLRQVAAMEAAYRSARTGAPVRA